MALDSVRRQFYEPPPQHDWVRIATNPQLADAVLTRTREARQVAQGLSHSFRDTGQYGTSFEAEIFVKLIRGRGFVGNRVVGRLSNKAPHARYVERKHKVLSRTRDQITQR